MALLGHLKPGHGSQEDVKGGAWRAGAYKGSMGNSVPPLRQGKEVNQMLLFVTSTVRRGAPLVAQGWLLLEGTVLEPVHCSS